MVNASKETPAQLTDASGPKHPMVSGVRYPVQHCSSLPVCLTRWTPQRAFQLSISYVTRAAIAHVDVLY